MSRTSMDMTRGSLKKQILFFSIPLMLSNLLQVLFNMSDIAVIGQFAGAMSLGAVGSTTTLISMYTGFLIGLSGGINVLTALYIGARNRKSVSETVHSAFLVSLAVGLILLILGVSTSRGVLVLLNTMGGDVEAGLAIAEMLASLSKPTVSLVLGGSHSIGVPIAVSCKYSFIVQRELW